MASLGNSHRDLLIDMLIFRACLHVSNNAQGLTICHQPKLVRAGLYACDACSRARTSLQTVELRISSAGQQLQTARAMLLPCHLLSR